MKRISQFIAATAKELTNGKRYPSRALVLNETTGEMRRGPGTWDEMPRYTVDVPVDVEVDTVATDNIADAGLAVGQTVNGVVLTAGMKVARVAQTDAKTNGVFVVPATGALERDTNYDTIAKLAGVVVQVAGGTKEGALYLCTNTRTGAVGTTDIGFRAAAAGTFFPMATEINANTLFRVYNQDGTEKVVDAAAMKTFFTA